MFRYLKHAEIDLEKWDACIKEAPNGLIYGLSWYLDTVSPGWEAFVKEIDGQYEAVMPLPVTRKFGIKYLRQPLLTQQLGVFHKDPLAESEWQQLFQLLKKHFQLISNYAFNTGNTDSLPLKEAGFEFRVNTNYELQLNKSYREIYSGFYKGRKAVINQAKKQNLIIRLSEKIGLLLQLYEANTASKIYGFIGEGFTYPIFRQLICQAQTTGTGKLYEVVSEEGEVQAMAFFLQFDQRLIYLLSTTSVQGKESGAISFLLHTLLEKNANSNFYLDFEAPQSHGPGAAGIIGFYRSFGPEPVSFISVSLNNLPAFLRIIKTIRIKLFRLLKQ